VGRRSESLATRLTQRGGAASKGCVARELLAVSDQRLRFKELDANPKFQIGSDSILLIR
jgi:hypothetical protein